MELAGFLIVLIFEVLMDILVVVVAAQFEWVGNSRSEKEKRKYREPAVD